GHHRRQPTIVALRPAVLDRDIPALGISDLLQAPVKCGHKGRVRAERRAAEKPDHRHRRLLCAHRQWPRNATRRRRRGCATADQRYKRAPPHSITSSASARSDGGTVRPSVLALFILMTSSNFVGCSTGRSAGFAPLNILSTKLAARK